MKKPRRDPKGRVLRKGEYYRASTKSYNFRYKDVLGIRRSVYANDLILLRKKEEQILRDRIDSVDMYSMGQKDINTFFDRYISTKTELRESTRTGYFYTYNKYVRDSFGKKPISKVRYSDVLLFYKSIIDQGFAVSVVEAVHTVLHPTFQMAVRDGVIRANPSDGLVGEIKKKSKSLPSVRHALSLEEQRAFLKCLDYPRYREWKALFIFLFGTGCRIGEVIGLRWNDVDFEKNTISINHSFSYIPKACDDYKCSYELALPKTKSGTRIIPMLTVVREALIEERERQEEYGSVNRMKVEGMGGFIFANRYGFLHKGTTINKEIKRIVEYHNEREEELARIEGREPVIIPNFSCHVIRHTFCTRLCENETNIKVIQSVMGHSDIQTTMNIYAEVSQSKQQEIFNDLNDKNVV